MTQQKPDDVCRLTNTSMKFSISVSVSRCGIAVGVLLAFLHVYYSPLSRAQSAPGISVSKGCLPQNNSESNQSLPNGIQVRCGQTLLQVVALREDVLRIREAAQLQLPEDASWAVPEKVRHQSVQ